MTDNLGQVTGREADIVVGVDGSDESFAALRWALGEASLTGQHVNAVFGWTHSWDMGAKPETDDAWKDVREQMTARLRDWVDRAGADMDFDPEKLKLTSVRATGTHALLELGSNAQQIVVGRRSLNRVARWFLGSLSASLAEEAKVPVTVVRFASDEEADVQDAIANSLTPGDSTVHYAQPPVVGENRGKPVVVGIDGSAISKRALAFAVDEARIHGAPLHILFCWQLKDLDTVPGYENAVAPMSVDQQRAQQLLDDVVAQAHIPDTVDVHANAFHIPAAKGLISASRYASHLVVGSRGLSGLDAHFLGSVSRQLVNFAECTVTVVH
ncbi:universal stress protein [Bifidobacterium thermophilum]|uniref:universal stress protein n=1 Tax=Bifidobacterium thermophilum TaxID=33905 RepID=UPI003F93A745